MTLLDIFHQYSETRYLGRTDAWDCNYLFIKGIKSDAFLVRYKDICIQSLAMFMLTPLNWCFAILNPIQLICPRNSNSHRIFYFSCAVNITIKVPVDRHKSWLLTHGNYIVTLLLTGYWDLWWYISLSFWQSWWDVLFLDFKKKDLFRVATEFT